MCKIKQLIDNQPRFYGKSNRMAEKTMKMWAVTQAYHGARPHPGPPQGEGAYGMKPQIRKRNVNPHQAGKPKSMVHEDE